MKRSCLNLSVFLFCSLCLPEVLAEGIEFLQGHIKAQYQYAQFSDDSVSASLGETDLNEALVDLRLLTAYSQDEWQINAHYQLNGMTGSAVDIQNQISSSLPALIATQDNQWFDLSHEISSDHDTRVQHGLDRLSVSYSADDFVFKLGRQALSWGNGLVFRPMDLFNPFSPDAIDTSYKPGVDMLYGQWLFDNGSDVSALIVPRRDIMTDELEKSESSAALKWHYFGSQLQADVMLAKDYDDTVLALAMNGPLGEAVWRADLVPVLLDEGSSRTSLIINVEHAWQLFNKNISGYLEYFRNGFGLSAENYTLTDLPVELVDRLSRSQVFNTGRDYLAAGARVELTPLMQFMPTLMLNMNDESMLVLLQAMYSYSQNVAVDFGLTMGVGPKGSEFGGIAITAGSADYLETANQLYARLTYYY